MYTTNSLSCVSAAVTTSEAELLYDYVDIGPSIYRK